MDRPLAVSKRAFTKVEVKTTDLGKNTYMLEGAGGNVTWIDPANQIVAVLRWIDPAAIDGFLARLMAALPRHSR